MSLKKILFVDRDGTLVREPRSKQINTLEELELIEDVIPCLLKLRDAGYRFVMVTNQDGLGTKKYPKGVFQRVQKKLLRIFSSQGIRFEDVRICPHLSSDRCSCRKPNLELVRGYLASGDLDWERSCVVGDRDTDVSLAKNIGIRGYKLGRWEEITRLLLSKPRKAKVKRTTKETDICVEVNLDGKGKSSIQTGIGFLDHMLEQLAKHSTIDLFIQVRGDLKIDEHHTVEDTALTLGEAIRRALGDKTGIERYGFVLPMDEAKAQVSCDFSGRPTLVFKARFSRERVGEFPTEMVEHFFRSLTTALGITLHIEVEGKNNHHMIEAIFKGVARTFKMALARNREGGVPSTKGVL